MRETRTIEDKDNLILAKGDFVIIETILFYFKST